MARDRTPPPSPEDAYIDSCLSPQGIEATERIFAGLCLHDHASFETIGNICRWDATTESLSSGFETARYNKLYRACMTLWGLLPRESLTTSRLHVASVVALLAQWLKDPTIMNQTSLLADEHELLRQEIFTYWRADQYTSDYILQHSTGKLINTWIRRRAVMEVNDGAKLHFQEKGNIDIDVLNALVQKATPNLSNDKEFPSMAQLLMPSCTQAISLGFEPLRKSIGSYFHLGDSTLIGAAKAGGKTILACQLALMASELNYPTVMFTTEESPTRLIPRFISNSLNLPVQTVRNAEIPYRNQPGQIIEEESAGAVSMAFYNQHRVKVDNLVNNILAPSLQFVDWSLASKEGVVSIDKAISHAERKLGRPPRLLIFDWVGGALSHDNSVDLRLRYNELFNFITDVAKARSLHAIVFCQLVTSSIGKQPTMNDLGESKSLPDRASNCVLVSSLTEKPMSNEELAGNEDKAMYKDLQYFVCTKARYGNACRAAVKREFSFQRFSRPSPTEESGSTALTPTSMIARASINADRAI